MIFHLIPFLHIGFEDVCNFRDGNEGVLIDAVYKLAHLGNLETVQYKTDVRLFRFGIAAARGKLRCAIF